MNDNNQSNPPAISPGRHRPLMPVLFGFAIGIAFQEFFSPPLALLLAALGLSVTVAFWVFFTRQSASVCWLTVFMLFLPLGAIWLHNHCQSLPPHHMKNLLSEQSGLTRLRARVSSSPRVSKPRHPFRSLTWQGGSSWMMRTEVRNHRLGDGEWSRTKGGVTVFGSGEKPGVRYGDVVEFMARVKPNQRPTNPGEPAIYRVYERAGSYGTASGVISDGVDVIERSPWYRSPWNMAERLRSAMRAGLREAEKGEPVHPLVDALFLGDRHTLPAELSEDLHDAGATHFLAISGLHVGIFAAGIWLVLGFAGLGAVKKHVVLIALVWFYVMFTGARISSIRAALMLSMVAGAPLLHRRADALSTLAGTALLILFWRPQELFSIGFHFTFLAVWAIFFIYPTAKSTLMPWRGFREKMQDSSNLRLTDSLWVYGSDYFLLSVSIWLAIVPLSALYFNRYSILLPLLNVVLWPLVLLLILSCFLAIIIVPVGGFPFRIFNYCSSILSEGIEGLLSWSRNLPGFVNYTPGPPLWWVYLYYGVVLTWVVYGRDRHGKWVLGIGAGILVFSILLYESGAGALDDFRVTVKDVGHGQSIMLRLPEGGVKLYDSGSTSYSAVRSASGVLWHNRVRSIGALTVSHLHFDHFCFVPELSKQFGIEKLLIPPKAADEPGALRRKLLESAEHYVPVREKTRISAGRMDGEFLHPDVRFLSEASIGRNDRSAVLLCDYKGWRLLLTGDAEDAALARLVHDYGERLRADVLVLPHHGAWTGELAVFLDAVNPRVAIASSGQPLSSGTKRLLEERGISIWTTFDDGAVTLTFEPEVIWIESYVSGRSQGILRFRCFVRNAG